MVIKTRDFFKKRIHTAKIERHNGKADELGQPTYNNADDWRPLVAAWPCEVLTGGGGERIRGRQVSANTTHVLIGDPAAVTEVRPEDRVTISGRVYNITAVYDPDGLGREYRIEARQSW